MVRRYGCHLRSRSRVMQVAIEDIRLNRASSVVTVSASLVQCPAVDVSATTVLSAFTLGTWMPLDLAIGRTHAAR